MRGVRAGAEVEGLTEGAAHSGLGAALLSQVPEAGPGAPRVFWSAIIPGTWATCQLLAEFDEGGALAALLSATGLAGSLRGGVGVAQSLVNDHFQVGLVAQAPLGRLLAGLGDVVGV